MTSETKFTFWRSPVDAQTSAQQTSSPNCLHYPLVACVFISEMQFLSRAVMQPLRMLSFVPLCIMVIMLVDELFSVVVQTLIILPMEVVLRDQERFSARWMQTNVDDFYCTCLWAKKRKPRIKLSFSLRCLAFILDSLYDHALHLDIKGS